jgi:S-DNA-T family DNA segregation ATPase FtsK/SpoIIIE
MEQRYKRFAQVRVRNIGGFNRQAKAREWDRMPYIVLIVDELADLMVIAPEEVERSLAWLAREAHAAGIHLIVATQRPSVDLVPGSIKASFPARISFAVASGVDSRVNIDTMGANRLWGPGAMLFRSPEVRRPMRLQGCYVSDQELQKLTDYWRGAVSTIQAPKPESLLGQRDEAFDKAVEIVRREGRASTTLLQRRLRIGYARAARLLEAMEDQGIVGPDQGGSRGRKVY